MFGFTQERIVWACRDEIVPMASDPHLSPSPSPLLFPDERKERQFALNNKHRATAKAEQERERSDR